MNKQIISLPQNKQKLNGIYNTSTGGNKRKDVRTTSIIYENASMCVLAKNKSDCH